jgi:hypothetical protein
MPVNPAASSRPTRSIELPALSTTNTGNGGWIDLSGFINWTLFLSGLEAASAVKIEVANGAAAPAGNGAILTSTLAPDANNCAQYSSTGGYHWLRVTKTQGTTPTATVGTVHAQFA